MRATRPAPPAPSTPSTHRHITVKLEHRGELTMASGRWAGHRSRRLMIHAVPSALRWAHRLYAAVFRRFWIACPQCGESFGGQEWRDVGGRPATVPLRLAEAGIIGMAICPACTIEGVGARRWAEASAPEVDDHRRPNYHEHPGGAG